MRTARSSSCHRGFSTHPGPGTPLGADPPGSGIPRRADPPAPTRHRPHLWTEFLTHASENITLPQTSFAGSNFAYLIRFLSTK